MQDIQALITQLTLEEKASLCSGLNSWYLKGVERLDIPSIMVTDGPHGLRKQASAVEGFGLSNSVPATCFPTASALAATWNRELIHQVGEALGKECRAEKVGVILGPGVNVKRSPLCGRNFEYFSEDPYLSGEIAKSHINGVQSQGIGTSIKHYAVNNQEYRRMTIDAIVDERALREIYLAGYEIAIKEAQPWTVMCAYNKVNGTYCSEHKYLMRDILKDEWGHEGLVVTDWGAMNKRAHGLAAGVELEMPGPNNDNDAKIVAAVQNGSLDEDILDQAVERILTMIFKAHKTLSEDYVYDKQAHHALARKVAGEGAVLLKNETLITETLIAETLIAETLSDGALSNEAKALPLAKNTKIALIGQFAKTPRYQGAGSSLINPTRLDNIYDEAVKLAGEEYVTFAAGYPAQGNSVDDELLREAVSVAQKADAVVICAGLPDIYEVEGLDRQHMNLPASHNALIEAIAKIHPRVIVTLSNGSPVEMPWANDVQAILEGYLGGQAGAGGVVDILYGKTNPSGKLAETFPRKLEDTPAHSYFPGGPRTVEYRESIYVGYRYFDTARITPLFPFGHGLSYTTFEYSDLQLSQPKITDTETLTVTLNIKNTGDMTGQEIVQLYVKDDESTAFRPEKELKEFAKIQLQPGEERQITFTLGHRAFAYYNTALGDWHVESGKFTLLVGASAGDIRLSSGVEVISDQEDIPLVKKNDALSPYYNLNRDTHISQEAFENLLGKPVPKNTATAGGTHTINTPLEDMKDTVVGRLLSKIMLSQIKKMIKDESDTPSAQLMLVIAKEAPLRTMAMAGEGVTRDMLEAVLLMVNGKFFKGMGALVKAVRANKE